MTDPPDRSASERQTSATMRDGASVTIWLSLVALIWFVQRWAPAVGSRAEPDTLRYRLLSLPARLARHARQRVLKLSRTWPWKDAFLACWQRLCALPALALTSYLFPASRKGARTGTVGASTCPSISRGTAARRKPQNLT